MEQRVGNDYVVVEPTTRIAYSLSGLPAEVWEATNGMSGSRYQGRASSGELNDIIANLTECGLLAPNGVPRRVVLRVGGVASMAGLVALALPSPADAASDSPGGALTLECGSNTITVGSSAQTRQVFFSITGGGGNGGGWNRSSATSGGAGGNAGVVSGSLTFPPGPVTTFILFPGCSGANGTNVGPAYGNPGLGIADTNGRSGSGGGAGGIEIAGVPFVVVGGGGGGGGAVTPPSVQPRGGDGSGAGPGSAGTTSSATSLATGAGGGGTAEAGGTAGTPTASNAAGTGPAPGPTGGIGGRPTQSGTSAAGGGGGGGYYGGGGGTGDAAGHAAGGGGGSGYLNGLTGLGSVTINGVLLIITAVGVASSGNPGAGAAPANLGTNNAKGVDGQANVSWSGGFTLTAG